MSVFLFEMLTTFLKQPSKNSAKLQKCVLQPTVFSSFILLAHFEFFLTCGLIAPPKFQELHSLKEFVGKNYTFVYWEDGKLGNTPIGELMKAELIIIHLDPEQFNKSSLKIPEFGDLWRQINPDKRDLCVLNDNAVINLRHVQNRLLGGKFKCYAVSNIAGVKARWANFQFSLRALAKKALNQLMKNGIYGEWDKLEKYKWSLKDDAKLPEIESPSESISFKNLRDFFAAYFITLSILGMLFIFVKLSHCGIIVRVVKI